MTTLSELFPVGGGGNTSDFVASGTLPNGKPVILKANGQVEVVSGSGGSQSIPLGSEVVYNAGRSDYNSVAFDPNNANKFVIVYKDNANSNYGTAIVGTVSGSNISFGSEVVFNSGNTNYTELAFDPNTANKFVVTYQDGANNSYGAAILGTISGTNISFGSEVVYQTSESNYNTVSFDPNTANKFVISYLIGVSSGNAIVGTVSGTSLSFGTTVVFEAAKAEFPAISFDPNTANKFIIAYNDGGDSDKGKAIVGTLSGTTTSFGSAAVFNTSATGKTKASFDQNTAGKFVVAYRGASDHGNAVVGTVSGTSISFGTAVVFNSATTSFLNIDFDPNRANKCVIAYRDAGNSNHATVIEGTVSGTGISFGSQIVVNSGNSDYMDVSFDPNVSGKFIVAYKDSGNSNYGTVVLGQFNTLQTNLTATNFLGTATAAYTNGQTASIMLKGGISDNQSSLTVGSTYYVQTNGTFATSAGVPPVLAGKAVSATSLLLNGLDEIPSQSGNTGKFLTTNGSAASWGTVAPAGLTLLSTVTASGVTTVLVDDTFDSTYDSYVLIASSMQASSNGSNLLMRLKIGGSIITSTTYYYRSLVINSNASGNTLASNQGTGTNEVTLVNNMRGRSYHSVDLELKFNNPSSTSLNHNWSMAAVGNNEDNRLASHIGGGTNKTLAAMTGVQLRISSGTLSGTFRLYGVAK